MYMEVVNMVLGFDIDVFFFFKQKTAYEMRISDWSSDVCSSDLNDIGSGLVNIELGARLRYEFSRQFAPYIGVSYLRKAGDTARLSRRAGEDVHEIGRASCRERVCQYV